MEGGREGGRERGGGGKRAGGRFGGVRVYLECVRERLAG